MLQFCINTYHSFLPTLSHNSEREYYLDSSSSSSSSHCRNILIGLRILIGEIQKPSEKTNVLVIRRVITIKMMTNNQDSTFLGFLQTSAGSVMESMSSCTESLGFESSDQLEEDVNQERLLSSSSSSSSLNTTTSTGLARSRLRRRIMIENERRMIDRRSEQVKNKIFPPPLSSLNQNGHRKFYLQSERENGRLEITVKKINRPEILRASRQDGRLTLCLMEPSIIIPGEPVSETESKEEAELKESEKELNELNQMNESVEEKEEVVEKKEEEVAGSDDGKGAGGGGGASDESWKFLLTNGGGGGGESYRRCHDLTQQHHHRVHLWSNHYVMTG